MAYFRKFDDEWLLMNVNLPDLYDVANKQHIPIGEKVILKESL